MIKYENLKGLFTFLYSCTTPKHWSDSFGWEMATILCVIVISIMNEKDFRCYQVFFHTH